jgi:Glycosyl hydrolases family 2, TIM barrel domain/Glycosyl hydrolases family 2, sugar binding domain/Glycosyl hydrolases family 2
MRMPARLRFGAILCSVLLAAPVLGATRTDLDRDWQFRVDPDEFGESFGWNAAVPSDTEAVNVPHSWNIGRLHDYLGVAWYFRRIEIPPHASDAHIELHFGATFYKSHVWFNGVDLGGHEGGFTAYSFDVTPYVRDTNVLAVRIDNRPDSTTIPGYGARGAPQAWYDWWTYGGVVRDVWLTSSGPVWMERQAIRTTSSGADALLHDHIYLHSAHDASTPLQLRLTAYAPDNRVAATSTQPLLLATGRSDIELSLKLIRPELWGIDHPNMYRLVAELLDPGGKALDQQQDSFGVRTIAIRDRHLLINGERVRLTGLARHEDSPAQGLAETPDTMQRDYDDLKALHTTLSRPVHYPQNPFILDYADRHGILLIPEIPVWQFNEAQLSDPKVMALAQQQMREMIEQAGSHPSIFAWSVANESAMGTPGGIAYFRAMRAMIRSIDPDRLVSFADDNLSKLDRAQQSAANDADFLMMNQYFGTWHGPAAALGPALDKVDRLFPDKMVIISEFGYPGPFAGNAMAADQARVRTIVDQLPVLAARDWIAGAILWCYQDYKSRRNLWPGQVEGFVEHGVVDEQRRRKPSYDVWKQLNAPASIEAQWLDGAEASARRALLIVTPGTEHQLPFYPLHHYRLGWRVLAADGTVLMSGQRQFGDLNVPQQLALRLSPDAGRRGVRLIATLLDATGAIAAERTLERAAAQSASAQSAAVQ